MNNNNIFSKVEHYLTHLFFKLNFKELWIMAAKYEFEANESIETARNLFQRALRFLPNNRKLWIEARNK